MLGIALEVLLGLVGSGAVRADGATPWLGFPSPPRSIRTLMSGRWT
jgi:hypothetical protein